MKVTRADMEVYSKILENEMKRIEGSIARFRHVKQPLDFDEIQDAIVNMAVKLPEFWESGSNEGDGGVTANLPEPNKPKTPGNAKAIPVT